MNSLLANTLRFLQENFDEKTTWMVKPSQTHLKNLKPAKKIEEVPVAPVKRASIPLSPPPPPPPPREEEKKEPYLAVEKERPKPISQNTPLGVDSLSDAVKGLFPQFTTHKDMPKDKDLRVDPVYKKLVHAEVVLFSFREGKESDLFLQNIHLAISAHFGSSAVLDVKKWELLEGNFDLLFKQAHAKLFIASDALYKKPSLLPFLKEIPSSSERFLNDKPLVLLQPFENYFNHPLQKKDLWKTLCATLKKSSSSQASS